MLCFSILTTFQSFLSLFKRYLNILQKNKKSANFLTVQMLALFYNRPFHFYHFFTFLHALNPLIFSLSTFLPFFSRLFTVLCSACKLTINHGVIQISAQDIFCQGIDITYTGGRRFADTAEEGVSSLKRIFHLSVINGLDNVIKGTV